MLARYPKARYDVLIARATTTLRLYSEKKSQHNQAIIDFLIKCQREEEARQDRNSHKVTSYKHAIQSISEFEKPIRLGNDLLKLQGVGPGIQMKINEFLYASEALERHHPQLQEELTKARLITILQSVPGIGVATAEKLVKAGCGSIQDLRLPQFLSLLLGETQRAKVRFMGHIEKPITKKEAEDVLNFCRHSLDTKYELALVGDCRRGISSFPEIQLMITHPNFVHIPLPASPPSREESSVMPKTRKITKDKYSNLLRTDLLPSLQQRGLIAHSVNTNPGSWKGVIRMPEQLGQWGDRAERLAGIDKLEGHFRWMNMNFVPCKSRGAYLLAFTGDCDFYRHLSLQAKQLGLLLNEYGLWKWNLTNPPSHHDDRNGDGESEKGFWSLVKSTTEQEILEELGLDFIDPTIRNYKSISAHRRNNQTSGFRF